jgi:hypothetical protein
MQTYTICALPKLNNALNERLFEETKMKYAKKPEIDCLMNCLLSLPSKFYANKQ